MTVLLQKYRNLSVSAASGLVIDGDAFYVIADDALHLHAYSLLDAKYEKRIRLLEGELPIDKKARKKQKPDFEALVRLPAQSDLPHGALLALGSGSKLNRRQGVLVPFHADGAPSQAVQALDLTVLYATLPFEDTNIEGALILGEQLVLMQRGNKKNSQSALVYLPLQEALQCNGVATKVVCYTLPCINDIPLGFTDGIALPNGKILFSAVAENTDDSFNDGACAGAAFGIINAQGELLHCKYLAEPFKIEGIALTFGKRIKLFAVTDADDPVVPAGLFEVELPEEWLR
ncbi:MAG TPA: hypothetical protein VLB90_07285 [Pseudomonadales bacterium]|nr:hypothetical protein [Pseudomonadales bacterium]